MENCLGDAWFCDAGQGVDQYSQRTQSLGENRQWETRRGPVSEMRGCVTRPNNWCGAASCSRSEPRSAVISLCFARVNTRQISHLQRVASTGTLRTSPVINL